MSASKALNSLDRNCPAAIATARARARVAVGIEEQLAKLRQLDFRKRAVEVTLFPALWLSGAFVTMAGYHAPVGLAHFGLRAIGTISSAVALNAFVLLMHEGMHHTLFVNKFLNRWVSVLFGATTLVSFTAYNVLHPRHHIYLGDSRDPDDYHNYTDKLFFVWVLHYVRLLAGSFLYIFLIPVAAMKYGTGTERRRILTEYGLLGLVYFLISLLVPFQILLHGWLIPLVLVAYMTNVRGLAQHGHTVVTDPFLASRSINVNRLVAFCLLNENFHLEHHLFPEVPSYNLRRLHDLIWSRLPRVVTGSSYTGFLMRFIRATPSMDETPIGVRALSGEKA